MSIFIDTLVQPVIDGIEENCNTTDDMIERLDAVIHALQIQQREWQRQVDDADPCPECRGTGGGHKMDCSRRTPHSGWEGNPIKEALAEQEEHLKRIGSCKGRPMRRHQFRPHGQPGPGGSIAGSGIYSACIECGVTESREDYAIKMGA